MAGTPLPTPALHSTIQASFLIVFGIAYLPLKLVTGCFIASTNCNKKVPLLQMTLHIINKCPVDQSAELQVQSCMSDFATTVSMTVDILKHHSIYCYGLLYLCNARNLYSLLVWFSSENCTVDSISSYISMYRVNSVISNLVQLIPDSQTQYFIMVYIVI